MPNIKTDYDPDDVPEVKDDVYLCRLGDINVEPDPSPKGFYMAVIRNVVDGGPCKGEAIWDRIITRHKSNEPVPNVAKRKMQRFKKATGANYVQGKGLVIPDNVKYYVESRNDPPYGPKANDYLHLSEVEGKQAEAKEVETEVTTPVTEASKAEPEVSFDAEEFA